MIKRSYKNPKRAVRHGLPFGSYITLTDMVRSSEETTCSQLKLTVTETVHPGWTG
jgi:hypothetical protein